MQSIKIGLVGFFHNNARGDGEAFTKAADGLQALAEGGNFSLHVVNTRVNTFEQGAEAVEELNDQNVDFTLMLCPSVVTGNAVIPFGHLRSLIGIWSLPEGAHEGFLPLNSFCGSMIFSGVLGTYLKDYHIPFKWFYGYTDNPLFRERFSVTLKALRAIASLRKSRIGCVGPLVNGFDYMAVDDSKAEKIYGSYIGRLHSVEEIVARAESLKALDVTKELEKIQSEGTPTERVSKESMERFASLNIALREFAKEYRYDALALSCWSRLQQAYGVVACGAVSRLNEEGLVVACEGDVEGAIGMLLEKEIGGRPSTMVDLVSVDLEDNSLNLWHCGPSPRSMADADGVKWDEHFNMGRHCNGEWQGCGAVADLQFAPGKVTVSRISSKANGLLVFTADMFSKPTYQGSSGWVKNITMQGQPMDIPGLMSALYNYRVDHHMTLGYGDNENVYLELAAWKNLNIARASAYVPYLEFPGFS